jgi:hypothetical protein
MFFNSDVAATSPVSDLVSVRRYFTGDRTQVNIGQCTHHVVRHSQLNRFCTEITLLSSSGKTVVMIHHYLDPDIPP